MCTVVTHIVLTLFIINIVYNYKHCTLPSLVGLGFVVSGSDGDLTSDASLVGDSPGLVPFNDPGANTSVVRRSFSFGLLQ